MRREATLIRSANLLAILRSLNDRQRERVADALTAGPPQVPGATPLPGTEIRR
jgi:3-methyladenine DNA glycosylase Mpg